MKAEGGIFLFLACLMQQMHVSVPAHGPQGKPGTCPLELDGLDCKTGTQAPLCKHDSSCTGDEKCCKYHCKFQCVKPVQVKEGLCPDWDASICPFTRPGPGICQSDSQCPGKERCCCYGCKQQCVQPVVKPGVCPVLVQKCGPPPSGEMCQSDDDCLWNQKCCAANCLDPEPVKPGMCPEIMAKCISPLPPPKCHIDEDCPYGQKCCSLCGFTCLNAVPEHPGICPSHLVTSKGCPHRLLTAPCTHDWHCEPDQKCCFSGYRKQCVKPLKQKIGVCPHKVQEMKKKKKCSDKCHDDRDCPGDEKCCPLQKGRVCMRPRRSTAVNGTPSF
ncbi:WAP four-disulfide core domain protein 8-like isoform X2 [Rhinatrema bivittatum]|uniref:WAP four-disulfide core domain protein 8-like isoform X2 n=1 Tax=Rhinatrema bivittatum TaxID=194408 RepID=UPI00112C4EE9|nr:WAP four-disulfide core domain protein 8-like isoform X2 [Rhinatrema bivittatum]